jgi:hypothetical protein
VFADVVIVVCCATTVLCTGIWVAYLTTVPQIKGPIQVTSRSDGSRDGQYQLIAKKRRSPLAAEIASNITEIRRVDLLEGGGPILGGGR